MKPDVMFSRQTDEWATPQEFYDALDAEFQFTVDIAASADNRKAPSWFGPDHPDASRRDALSWRTWKAVGTVWCNPPYSQCREFIATAARTAAEGDATVVCLVPSRTDTRWWMEHVWDHRKHELRPDVEIRFIKGRLKFGGSTNSAPFPSVVIIFRRVTQ